jgi:hypothetical protein
MTTSIRRARTSSRSLRSAGLSVEPPEWPPSPLPVPMNFQPSWGLALQVGSRGLPLIVERVELLLQAMLGRNTGVDGAGSRISRRGGLSALPAPRRTNERHLRVCGRELARRPRQASRLAVIIAGKQFCLGARSARKARCSTPWSSHGVTRSPYLPIHELHRLDDVRLRSMTTLQKFSFVRRAGKSYRP